MKQQLQIDIFDNNEETIMNHDNMKKEQVHLIRHLRPFTYVDGKKVMSPKGGIVFYIHINQILGLLTYSWAICHPEENFNRKLGEKIATGRFNKYYGTEQPTDLIASIPYVRTQSLVTNIFQELYIEYLNTSSTHHLIDIWSDEKITLLHTMKDILSESGKLSMDELWVK
jgi:hypothetical protein